jgi:hypothetical protein
MLHHMIQTDMFHEFGFRRLVDAVNTLKLPYSIFKLPPFDHNVEVVEGIFPGGAMPTMVWGFTTVEEVVKKYGWVPGVFKNDNFSHRVLNEKFGSSMLNSDGQFYKMGEVPSFEGARFIRPVLDTKSFTGQLINGDEFEKWREELYALRHEYTTLDLNTEVMVASPKHRIDEARFFVVDKRVVAGSTYRVNGRVLYKEIGDDNPLYKPLWRYAEAHTQTFEGWTPCEAFVMDIARVEPGDGYDKFRVIEINCINSSGFYDCNMTAVVKAVENLKPWPNTWRGTPWFDERTEKAVAEWKASLGV